MENNPFWQKKMSDMTLKEWESLCDGCGICCLEKFEDHDTGDILYTHISCRFLDIDTCRCRVYGTRLAEAPNCLKVTPETIHMITWLPESCAYRCLAENRPLPDWHPLKTGNPESVHSGGHSVRGRVISGEHIHPDDLENFIV